MDILYLATSGSARVAGTSSKQEEERKLSTIIRDSIVVALRGLDTPCSRTLFVQKIYWALYSV